uniref:BHLH domain-containing protein n=1 Tax=Seriola lalandi dorsalis TaxID=1841481 RepID=A0A3B4X3E1_SERLL
MKRSCVIFDSGTNLLCVVLRKPLVEKLRRERINSSIEQLKSLLGPDFLKQQPDSKLEKADILEMTVCFLTQLQQQNQQQRRLLNLVNKLQSSSEKNLMEADFSLLSSTQNQQQRRLLNLVNKLQSSSEKNLMEADFSLLSSTVQTSITKEIRPVNSALWRPW